MKLLVVAESLEPRGGWGSYSLGLLRGLAALGVEARVLLERHAPPEAPDGLEAVACLSSPLGGLVRPEAMGWNALQMLRHAGGCDLLHYMVEPYATASLPLGLPPSLITIHGTYAISPFRESILTRSLYAAALRRARRVVCVSRFTRDALLGKVGLDNVSVIHNGHDLLPRDEDPADAAPIEGQPVILSVGALKARKGYDVSVRAVARLRARFPDLRYYIVGDDADRKYVDRLRASIDSLGMRRQAIITGSVSDARLRAFYQQADLFLLTPINVGQSFEGFGIAYLEANAYGKPVVGSAGCGAEEAVENEVNGLLAPQHDEQAVAECAARILGDTNLAGRLGAAGRARAEAQTWTSVARQYLELYQDALR
jgi:phosphatidylinositol alpha-1,6-mannosyltransferase